MGTNGKNQIKMKESKTILIDISMIAVANYHILVGVYGENIPKRKFTSNVESNIENILFQISKTYKINHTILCFDAPNYFRKNLYEEYKSNRKPKANYKELLDSAKISLMDRYKYLLIDELEADDLIYLCATYQGKDECIIVSNDADLHQIGCLIFSPTKKQFVEYEWTLNHITKKILEGCSGDNVPKLLPRLMKKHWQLSFDSFYMGRMFSLSLKQKLKSLYDIDLNLEDLLRNYCLVIFDLETYNTYVKSFDQKLKTIANIFKNE